MTKENAAAAVTTSRQPSAENLAHAEEAARALGLPYVPRGTLSLDEVRERAGAGPLLVAKQGLLMLDEPDGQELFFHPNMAHLRIKNLHHGQGDRMAEAMGLTPGMTVLDGTLGLGADAIVASFVAGEAGHVTGVESSPLVHAVVSWGLAHAHEESPRVEQAMRRVTAVCMDSLDYLRAQPDRSVDIVYFDPMFRHPFYESKALSPLRGVANPAPLCVDHIREACRVARRRVVLKESARSGEFARLGFPVVTGGRYSKVHYGVLSL